MGHDGFAEPAFGPAAAILELAVAGRWRSPGTTAALADYAVARARAEADVASGLLAEGWLLHGLVAVGRGAGAVPRAVGALAEAARLGHREADARLRVGLAAAARELGDPISARTLLAPVLDVDTADPELAADAHVEAVRSGVDGVQGVGDDLLAAVDVAVGCIRRLRGEQVEFALVALDVALANRHRTAGRWRAAASRASEGLRRLLGNRSGGAELDPISPHLAAWLCYELTTALFDGDQPDGASRASEPALAWTGRPEALVPLTRLRLTLAQRVHLPAGEYSVVRRAVAWAADAAGERDLPQLEAECQSLLAEVHEQRGALSESLAASQRAQRALRRHAEQVEHALVLLGRDTKGILSAARPSERSTAWISTAGSGPTRAQTVPGGPVEGVRPVARSAVDGHGRARPSRCRRWAPRRMRLR